MSTISRGLQLARSQVRLWRATAVDVAAGHGTVAVRYEEDLVIPGGVALRGDCAVSGAVWTCGAAQLRAQIVNVSAEGIRFEPGAVASMTGFAVHAKEGAAVRAINIEQADVTLTQVDVFGASGSNIDEQVGIRAVGSSIWLTGVYVGPLQSWNQAKGIELLSPREVHLLEVSVVGSNPQNVIANATGIFWRGGPDRPSTLDAVTVRGGEANSVYGLWVECMNAPGSVTVRNSVIRGGTPHDGWVHTTPFSGFAYGLFARGCDFALTGSDVIAAEQCRGSCYSHGVTCSGRPCLIENNRSLIGSLASPTDSLFPDGLSCWDCTVRNNALISAGAGLNGVAISTTSGVVELNRIVSKSPLGCRPGWMARGDTGVSVTGSAVIRGNSISVAGGCDGTGLRFWTFPDAGTEVSVVVGNTVSGEAAAVEIDGAMRPIFRGNIFTAAPPADGGVFVERVAGIHPIALEANDFFSRSFGGAVYVDAAGQPVSPYLLRLTRNITIDPGFSVFPALGPASPLRGRGPVDAGMPDRDLDGDPRPLPAGTSPDIGADEVP